MRFVDRNGLLPPGSLAAVGGVGQSEFARALAYYAGRPSKSFEFTAYKDAGVVSALKELFHSKCAYCETSLRAFGPMDVEHFRPKGAIAGEPNHPGYWWLASEWHNLLPSCIDCNRRRGQIMFNTDGTIVEVTDGQSGKHNAFPIRAPQHRAVCQTDALALEDALLINPCERHPEDHIEWQWVENHGQLLPLAAARMHGALPDEYATTSIAVFGLNRSGLVEDRMEMLNLIELLYRSITSSIMRAADVPPDKVGEHIPRIITDIENLKAMAHVSRRYSACATQFVAAKLERLRSSLAALTVSDTA